MENLELSSNSSRQVAIINDRERWITTRRVGILESGFAILAISYERARPAYATGRH